MLNPHGRRLGVERSSNQAEAWACSVAGLTRPTAGALVVAVLLALVLDARSTGLGPALRYGRRIPVG